MKRREFVERLGVGSAALLSVSGGAATAASKDHHSGHDRVEGSLASVTVSFGAWPSGGATPLNRLVTPAAPAAPNVHQMIPYLATVKAGGAINFQVAGAHLIAIYEGVKFEDIDGTITAPLPGAPAAFPPYVDDPAGRIYLGANLFGAPQDRVEVVQFPSRGRFLVICAFLPHFEEGMHGWVRVVR